MKFLIDTNIFIPLEPTKPSDQEITTPKVRQFFRLALEQGHQIYMHPIAKVDVERDKDSVRKELRLLFLEKYPPLPDAPGITSTLEKSLGAVKKDSNDWVDHHLISSVQADAVDFLISEDRKLRKKARKLGLQDRVLFIDEGLTLLGDLSDLTPLPPQHVEAVKAHRISNNDPILASLRNDYPGFDAWFSKCKKEHRQAWIIPGEKDFVAGFCLVNPESDPPPPLSGMVLKLCTFKVSHDYNGLRYGELLLKSLLEHGFENHYDWLYVTTFNKQEKLIDLFEDFGFSIFDSRTKLGELILAKPMKPSYSEELNPLDFHILYGPKYFKTNIPWYAIPIQPKFAEVLFPDSAHQMNLFPGDHPSGNAIKKAYLCHANINELGAGSGVVFYRSSEDKGIIALGIVENEFRTDSPDEIVRYVGRRTVYSLREIQEMCLKPVKVILFREARTYFPEIPRSEILQKLFTASPQSIIQIKEEGVQWIKENLVR